ncbi:MAG: FHA domain-containing protein [Chloroflexota bacterium]
MHLWVLHTIKNGGYTEEIWIDEFHELTAHRHLVGRTPTDGLSPDILLPYPGVSRRHAFLMSTNGAEWYVEDIGTANGTYLLHSQYDPLDLSGSNFRRIRPKELAKLQVNDHIVFAGTVVTQLTDTPLT